MKQGILPFGSVYLRSTWLESSYDYWRRYTQRKRNHAKYKRIQHENVPNADLYQLLAYVTALNLPGGLLVYAKGEAEPVIHEVRHYGKWLEIAALDLSGTLDEILDRVGDLAGRVRELREQAIRLRPAA